MSLNKDEGRLAMHVLTLQEAINTPTFAKDRTTHDSLKYHLDGITRALMLHIGYKEVNEYLTHE